ncbi:MAG: hypothetical protein ACXVCY_05705 [Pseudobdellovibrionaceae bacterium]
MKHLLASTALVLACAPAFATEITPTSLIGHYGLKAVVGATDIHLDIRVLSAKEFQLQRIHPDGKKDQLCDGTFTINPIQAGKDGKIAGKIFKGLFTCPDNRTQQTTISLDLTKKTMEDLEKGTTVPMMSSLAPTERIKAFIKKMK